MRVKQHPLTGSAFPKEMSREGRGVKGETGLIRWINPALNGRSPVLQQIGTDEECSTMRQLDVGHLQRG